MYHKVMKALLIILSFCIQTQICCQHKNKKMDTKLLDIKVKCKGNEKCYFEGNDMFIDIVITNNQNLEIGFPLEYVQARGPIIKLHNTHSKAESSLKTNLADEDLAEKFTHIQPGKSVTVEWVITSGELQQFNIRYVDLSAEFTIMTKIEIGGKKVDFRGSDTIKILSKHK